MHENCNACLEAFRTCEGKFNKRETALSVTEPVANLANPSAPFRLTCLTIAALFFAVEFEPDGAA